MECDPRKELMAQIIDISPKPGTVLIVSPKYEVKLDPDFANWLADTLSNLLPEGSYGIVLPENVTNFSVVGPLSDDDNYRKGYFDAVKDIQEINQ